MRRELTRIAIALSLLWGAGCLGEAPHDNPLDPNSDRFVEEGRIEGRVTDRAEVPLAGVEVHLVPDASTPLPELVTRTDSQGRFFFEGVSGGDGYRLQAFREGYATTMLDAFNVEVGLLKQVPTMRLNALPVFVSMALRTVHISRWWPQDDLFSLEIDTRVDDADGLFDIDRVWFEIPELNYIVALDPQAAGRFEKLIQADSLPTPSLQSLVGQSLQLRVRDVEGVITSSAPQQLVRVLEGTPTPTAPRDDALLETAQPLLQWDAFTSGFSFTYRVDVYRAEVNRDVLVLRSDAVPRNVTSLQLTTPLATGPYFWTVTVVDDFGNQSRSKEAAFRIP